MYFTPFLNHLSQSIGHKLNVSLTLGAALFVLSTGTAHAQLQREIINPSFEDGPTPRTFSIHPDTQHPGWISTNGTMETWADGFLRRDAQEGDFLIELNPNSPIGLYQEICLLNGEELSWDLYHAARGTGGNQTINYEVVSLDGTTTHQLLTSNTVTGMGANSRNNAANLWDNVVGTTTYTGPTGVQRLQFRSTNAGSAGNFLDDINVALVPFVTFNPTSTSDFETGSGPYPEVSISGELLIPTTVTFSVLPSSTATLGVDYSLASNTSTSPAGSYDGVSSSSLFALPVTVLTDAVVDPNETIDLQIDSAVAANPALSPALASAPGVCENGTLPMATHTILDVPPPPPMPSVAMTKVADNPGPHTVGDVVTYTYTVTNDGNVNVRDIAITDTHNGSDPAPVPGNEILLTDTAPAGDSTDAATDGSWDVLAPGDVVTFTGTYTVTQTDVDNL